MKPRPLFLVMLAVVIAAGVVDRRLARARAERENWNARVAQRQQLRWLSAYITAYARDYGRPAFYLDSVEAHLDSATAAKFRRYRVDLWGDRVLYWWTETSFELASRAGVTQSRLKQVWDSVDAEAARDTSRRGWERMSRVSRRLDVREEYWWPVEARGRRNRLGQFTQAPALNPPMIVRAARPDPKGSPPPRFPDWPSPGSVQNHLAGSGQTPK